MIFRSIRAQQFRNHRDTRYELSPQVTVFYGENGSGKTSLLEAIYILCRGSSFKAADIDIVNYNQEWYRIDMSDEAGFKRTISFDNRDGRKQKSVTVDNKKSLRMPAKYKYPVILFTPDDTRLINGSPSRRRKYFDQIISQYRPEYTPLLRRYERALQQRNKLLKRPSVSPDDVFAWNVILSNTGAEIIEARRSFVEYANSKLTEYYQAIAKNNDEIIVSYIHPVTTANTILSHLETNFDRDRITGSTSVGPHRHDYHIFLREKLADDIASRGEIRTIILALKYIEADKLREIFSLQPLILLDDVFGELDNIRQQHLMNSFSNSQIIITSTNSVESMKISSQVKLSNNPTKNL